MSKSYKDYLMKAQKMYLLSKSKLSATKAKGQDKDLIKYYLKRSVKYLKSAMKHIKSERDQSRIHLMLYDSYYILAQKQSDMSKNAKCFKICL